MTNEFPERSRKIPHLWMTYVKLREDGILGFKLPVHTTAGNCKYCHIRSFKNETILNWAQVSGAGSTQERVRIIFKLVKGVKIGETGANELPLHCYCFRAQHQSLCYSELILPEDVCAPLKFDCL